MTTLFSALAALVVSGLAAFLFPAVAQLPAVLTRFGRGLPVLLGVLAGFTVLLVTGGALNLIVILLLAALIVAALDTVLATVGAHRVWRVLGQGVMFAAAMALEWKRGDLFLTNAAFAVLAGIAVMGVVTFATEAAAEVAASRLPAQVGVLAVVYLAVIAVGLPNPGLLSLVVLVGAAVLPGAVLAARSNHRELLLGPLLGALGWALGTYAWLANASPAMVIAPIAIVGIDVCWTLVRRLTTRGGRAWLAEAGTWWRGIDRWAQSGQDLLVQRVAAASSRRTAFGWLIGGTVVCLALGLLGWQLDMRWLLAAVILLLAGVGWVLVQQSIIGLSRADLFSWLAAVTALAGVIAVGARLTDGRLSVTAVPLVVAVIIWVAALARVVGPLASARGSKSGVAQA